MRKDDFTEKGAKIEAAYENDRNTENGHLFKAIIQECFNVSDVICGHHLSYEYRETRGDGFTYTMVQEIPSADALIFDHDIAKKVWGPKFKDVLVMLALEPVETRDELLGKLYYGRKQNG